MNILYEDSHFFILDKPAGFFVHPPERSPYPVPDSKICLYQLRRYYNQEVFPVHRLDAPTSGLVIFAFDREGAGKLSRLFREREIQKGYEAIVRGHVEPHGKIEMPLEVAGEPEPVSALTHYQLRAHLELPYPVGKKYSTSRYSWVQVQPETGRWHQIRRHFDRLAHPLVGDIEHGDTYHNRFFRDTLKIPGLCLKAASLEFVHPWTEQNFSIHAPLCEQWRQLKELFKHSPDFWQNSR